MSNTESNDAPLKILIGANVAPDPNAGASGTVWQMNAALRRRGHQVDEIWADKIGRRIQHGNLHYLLELPRAYRREVRNACVKQQYDVIELNQPHAHLAAVDHKQQRRLGVFVNRSHGHETLSEETLEPWRRELGILQNQGLRGMVSRGIQRLLDRQWKVMTRAADGIVVSCSNDARFLQSRYDIDESRIGTITQGVPQVFLDLPVKPMTTDRLQKILYIGQLAFFKAPTVLTQSVNQILDKNPQATMTLVCSESHHAYARQLLNDKIVDRVNLIGWMDQSSLLTLLDTHGIFLFPSYFEGFGKAPLEAMSRGLCVVATEVGGMRDYIAGGRSGFLVPPGNAKRVAEVTIALMNDIDLSKSISNQARSTAEQHTWDRCAADAESFYLALLARKHLANG